MRYPVLSNRWRLDMAIKPKMANGQTITEHGHSRVLTAATQMFPFTFFPDKIFVEDLRIVWLKKKGPWMDEVVSIMATDIASVNCSTSLFFGHIHIKSLTGGPEIMVDKLLRRDVLNIRSLVEGIALSAREGLRIPGDSVEAEKQNLMRAGAIN